MHSNGRATTRSTIESGSMAVERRLRSNAAMGRTRANPQSRVSRVHHAQSLHPVNPSAPKNYRLKAASST